VARTRTIAAVVVRAVAGFALSLSTAAPLGAGDVRPPPAASYVAASVPIGPAAWTD
jgi:hypothetical protein